MDVVRVQLPTKIFLEEPFKVLFEDIVSQASYSSFLYHGDGAREPQSLRHDRR